MPSWLDYRPEWKWLGRSLKNYKAMHAKGAEAEGRARELASAATLTEARKIVFGVKPGQVPVRKRHGQS